MKAKRTAALGLAAVMAASLLSGCGAGGSKSAKTEITIYQSKIEANEGYNKAIAAYEESHPAVKINLEAVTGNDFAASLKAKMQSDPPTIFSVGGFQDLKDYGDILEDISIWRCLRMHCREPRICLQRMARCLRFRFIWKDTDLL